MQIKGSTSRADWTNECRWLPKLWIVMNHHKKSIMTSKIMSNWRIIIVFNYNSFSGKFFLEIFRLSENFEQANNRVATYSHIPFFTTIIWFPMYIGKARLNDTRYCFQIHTCNKAKASVMMGRFPASLGCGSEASKFNYHGIDIVVPIVSGLGTPTTVMLDVIHVIAI